MMSCCTTHVTSKYGCAADELADYHSFAVYYPFKGHIHLYEVDCCSLELGEAVVVMRNPNQW